MTDLQKATFYRLMKEMEGGTEYRAIYNKNQSRIACDDEFHNLVLAIAQAS